jgi:methylglyoxal/glyoxal reductase
MEESMIYKKLSNGVEIPMIGFGTFKIPNDQAAEIVKNAIFAGYRHIDTAAIYRNEVGVGKGIKESHIAREEIFLTTKCWNDDQGYQKTLDAFEQSCQRLQTKYIDLYLIHWPKPLNSETWKAFEELYQQGRIKAIGVSNFHQHHFEELMKTAKIKPMVNQIEYTPRLTQQPLKTFLEAEGVAMESWSPLMRGKVSDIELLQILAEKYKKTIAQIVIRWNIDTDVIVIPKSATLHRIKENFDIFDFSLSQEDIEAINLLNKNLRTGPDPDNFDF